MKNMNEIWKGNEILLWKIWKWKLAMSWNLLWNIKWNLAMRYESGKLLWDISGSGLVKSCYEKYEMKSCYEKYGSGNLLLVETCYEISSEILLWDMKVENCYGGLGLVKSCYEKYESENLLSWVETCYEIWKWKIAMRYHWVRVSEILLWKIWKWKLALLQFPTLSEILL